LGFEIWDLIGIWDLVPGAPGQAIGISH
jgi:hypothetical protein